MSGGADPISLAVVLALLALVPLAAVMTTSFLKIAVVLTLVRNALGEKLSKQTGALAVCPGDEGAAVAALREAARFLGIEVDAADSPAGFHAAAVPAWSRLLQVREAARAGA